MRQGFVILERRMTCPDATFPATLRLAVVQYFALIPTLKVGIFNFRRRYDG